ncbi:ribosomal protein L2 [Acrasis kona]|uniref:Ribosomal protein L2 n=1 Tax=Acrasis kona TaxID=1008807 RepID=A0AAW2ZJV3_9EUKA
MLRLFKATTPSQRFLCLIEKRRLMAPMLSRLKIGSPKQAGRNVHGHITVRHQGGGFKQSYRAIDWFRNTLDIPAKVISIEYDPMRSSFISLVYAANGIYCYVLASHLMNIGSTIINRSVPSLEHENGDTAFLKDLYVGARICAVESYPGGGAVYSRSAGTASIILRKRDNKVVIRLPSGDQFTAHELCRAQIGQISNPEHRYINYGKAGRMRNLGVRPSVRGVAMNPVDHPHGGGEGKKSKKAWPRTPWGKQHHHP